MTAGPVHTPVRKCGQARAGRGFTLVEMVIVVAIFALVTGVVATAVGNTSRADMLKQSGTLASAMRAAYDSAALSGQTYRLAFVIGDPKKPAPQTVRVEASPELLVFDPTTSTLTRALAGSHSGSLSWDAFASTGSGTGSDSDQPVKAGFAALDGPAADAIDKVLGSSGKGGAHANSDDKEDKEGEAEDTGFKEAAKAIPVDEDVRLLSVWTEGMDKPADEGEVYIYFFPNGYAQDALVHLQDKDKAVVSVRLAALTGKPTILEGYVEAPE